MSIINEILRIPIAFIVTPLESWQPVAGLVVMSMMTGAIALFIVERASPHERLSLIKRSIVAGLLEIVIFNHDLKTIANAQWQIVKLNIRYAWASVVPLMLTSVPILLVMAHLHGYYGYTGLMPGRSALLTVDVASNDRRPPLTIEAPEGVRILSPMVWIPTLHQAIYRILPTRPGEYNLTVRVGAEAYEKTVVALPDWVSRSPARVPTGFASVLYPAEDPLPDNQLIRRISVDYPETDLDVAGWQVHWSWLFLGLSILVSVALKAIGVFQTDRLLSRR